MHVLIRVDAGPSIGVGHGMRCATLARELRARGHLVTVATTELVTLVEERLSRLGVSVRVIDPTTGVRPLLGEADAAVVDGYHLGHDAGVIANSVVPLTIIDDNHELPVQAAALVVNQNLHAFAVDYPQSTDSRYLLGPSFALIRPDVLALRSSASRIMNGTILVAIGGTDPRRLTVPVVAGLLQSSSDRIVVAPIVLDRGPPAIEDLRLQYPGRIEFAETDLLGAFLESDLAVIGGGSTLWEVAFLGIPAVAAVVADNQIHGAAAAQAAGFAVAVDCRVDASTAPARLVDQVHNIRASPPDWTDMSAAGRKLFDGRGAGRVVDAIEATVSP